MQRVVAAALGAFVMVGCAIAQENATTAPEGPDVVIHAGHVLAVPGEGYLTEQTIVVRDGRIAEVAPGYQRVDDASSVTVIDLKDAYVLPGLVDAHVHITSEFRPGGRIDALTKSDVDEAFDGALYARRTLMAGFTAVQDVGGSNEAIFSLRDAIADGKVPGPRMKAAGQAVSATGGHGDANGFSPRISAVLTSDNVCDGADDCRRAVRQLVKDGADVIKVTATGGVLSNTAAGLDQQLFDDELVAIVETAESMGRKVTAHAHGTGGINAALRAGIHSIEHGTYLDDESIALFKANNATLVPTVLAGETVTGWDWLPPASREKAAEVGPRMVDSLRRAREGGVRVAFGTDTGVSKHGLNAQEFSLMIQAGYAPEEAIRTATVIASEHIGMDQDVGTITEGKFADLIAVDADPLRDIAELEDVDFVMQGGQIYKDD